MISLLHYPQTIKTFIIVTVLEVDIARKRIALSLKDAARTPGRRKEAK